MKKPLFLLSILATLVFTTIAQKPVGEKITICHIPPGNPENAHAITISINALQAHLNHGDSIGSCETNPPAGLIDHTYDVEDMPHTPTISILETDEKDNY